MSVPKPVETFYERIWNDGDLEAISDLLTEDFKFRGSLGMELQGRAAFRDYVLSVQAGPSTGWGAALFTFAGDAISGLWVLGDLAGLDAILKITQNPPP